MLNSKLKRLNLSFQEIIDQGLSGNIKDLSTEDWEYIQDQFESESACIEEVEEGVEVVPLKMYGQGSVELIQDDWTEGDSDLPETLELVLGTDNDIHIRTNSPSNNFLRFRNMIGGGMYPNTHFALRSLYDAMKEDLESVDKTSNGWQNAANRYMRDK